MMIRVVKVVIWLCGMLALSGGGIGVAWGQDTAGDVPTRNEITVENAAQMTELQVLETGADFINDLEFCATGQLLAVVETSSRYEGFRGEPGVVRLWDAITWQEADLIDTNLSATSVAFEVASPYCNELAIGYTTGEIVVLLLSTRQPVTTAFGHDSWINAMWMGGGTLYSVSGSAFFSPELGDSKLRGWILTTPEAEEFIEPFPEDESYGAGRGVAVSPQGLRAAGFGGRVVLFGSERMQILAILEGYGFASNILFTPDGSRILYAARDGVRVWDIESAVENYGYIPGYVIIAPTQEDERELITSLDLSPNGAILAVGYANGKLRLWDMETGVQFAEYDAHNDRVMDIDFSADGTRLASGGADGVVRIWGIADQD